MPCHPSATRQNTAQELSGFDRQVFLLEESIEVLRSLLTLLLATRRCTEPTRDSRSWLQAWLKKHRSEKLSWNVVQKLDCEGWLLSEHEIATELGVRHVSNSYCDTSFSELSDLCEQRRADIKHLWEVIEVYRSAVDALIDYRCGLTRTRLSARHYVVSELLQRATRRNRTS